MPREGGRSGDCNRNLVGDGGQADGHGVRGKECKLIGADLQKMLQPDRSWDERVQQRREGYLKTPFQFFSLVLEKRSDHKSRFLSSKKTLLRDSCGAPHAEELVRSIMPTSSPPHHRRSSIERIPSYGDGWGPDFSRPLIPL